MDPSRGTSSRPESLLSFSGMKGGPLGLDTFSRCTAFCGVYEGGMHILSVTTVRWDLRANTYTLLCYGSLLSGGVSWLGLLGCRGGRRRRGTCLLFGRRISRKIATSKMGFLDGPRDDDADWAKCLLLFRLPTSVPFWFIKKLLWVLLRSIASPGRRVCALFYCPASWELSATPEGSGVHVYCTI